MEHVGRDRAVDLSTAEDLRGAGGFGGGMKSVKGTPSKEAPGRSRSNTAASSEEWLVNFKSSPNSITASQVNRSRDVAALSSALTF